MTPEQLAELDAMVEQGLSLRDYRKVSAALKQAWAERDAALAAVREAGEQMRERILDACVKVREVAMREEREACARVAEEYFSDADATNPAVAIRARSASGNIKGG